MFIDIKDSVGFTQVIVINSILKVVSQVNGSVLIGIGILYRKIDEERLIFLYIPMASRPNQFTLHCLSQQRKKFQHS